MKIGSKSVLFGVHAFWFHPITVVKAWKYFYGRFPTMEETLCILVHDLGYWGSKDIDGSEGVNHPTAGGRIAARLVYWYNRALFRGDTKAGNRWVWAYGFCVTHSKHYTASIGANAGPLYPPDKLSILFDPVWFYLFRARLSGELKEWLAPTENTKAWLLRYRDKVKHKHDQGDPYGK